MAIKNLGRWSQTSPWLGAKKRTAATWPTYVCRNKACKSYGKSHPNCKCGAPYAALQKNNPGEYHADGGVIDAPMGALPMDEPTRLGRAQGMGFNTSQSLYHGTQAEIDKFKPHLSKAGNMFGAGIYTTPMEGMASQYAGEGPGANVLPVYSRTEKHFDLDDAADKKLKKELSKTFAGTKRLTDAIKKAETNNDLFHIMRGNLGPTEQTAYLQSAGYDALWSNQDKTLNVFDANKLRSKFAAFDPSKKEKAHLSYAEGGEVGNHCDTHQPHHESCEHYADGSTIQANHDFENHPDLTLDHAIANHGLLHTLTKSGHSKSENQNKPTEELIDHASRGRKSLKSHTEHHFDHKHEHPEVGKDEISALKSHLDSIRENPSQLLDTGGFPGFPKHSAALGAKAAAASDYFDALKPKQAKPGPLDPAVPPSKLSEQSYNRQLGIAEKPLSILEKVRNGTVLPSDMQTLNTLYPELAHSILTKAYESLVSAKTSGTKISYKHKMGLSLLLGQPLDATMTQPAMQAIMKANAGAQTESQGPAGPHAKSGATAETQKTIKGVDNLYKTSLEKIQTGK